MPEETPSSDLSRLVKRRGTKKFCPQCSGGELCESCTRLSGLRGQVRGMIQEVRWGNHGYMLEVLIATARKIDAHFGVVDEELEKLPRTRDSVAFNVF
jgi:hypothetical protein